LTLTLRALAGGPAEAAEAPSMQTTELKATDQSEEC
jgi:hypothetical protein